MLADAESHHLATSLFYKHGEGALAYALRNAQTLGSRGSQLEEVWMRVAKKIERLISTASQDRRISGA
jgi:hypothetical protein